MPLGRIAENAAERLTSKLSQKDLADWGICMDEASSHFGFERPAEPTASALLDLSLERMLLELRDDLGDERDALAILFGNNDFMGEMARRFPRGGRIGARASLMDDASVLAWFTSDKAKLGRMAAEALERRMGGLGQRLLPKLSVANLAKQGGLELEELAHLEAAQGMWRERGAIDNIPSTTVVGLPNGHALSKWFRACSERLSVAKRACDDEAGHWKSGVDSSDGWTPLEYANVGSCFELWSDFRPEALLERLEGIMASGHVSVAKPKRFDVEPALPGAPRVMIARSVPMGGRSNMPRVARNW